MYDYSPHYEATAAVGIIMFVLLLVLIIGIVSYIACAFLMSRIFKKAGIETWKAWVPVYNSWTMLELGDQPGFWAVVAFIPPFSIASAVFYYIAMYNIGLKLGKEGAFVLLAIFIPIVWLIWLAVDDSKWQGKEPAHTVPPYVAK